MSAMLLLEPSGRPPMTRVGHCYADDLESFFHILLHQTLSHLTVEQYKESVSDLRVFMRGYFDEGKPIRAEHKLYGGSNKQRWFLGPPRIDPFTFEGNPSLTTLICELRTYFRDRYTEYHTQAERDEQDERFASSSYFVQCLNKVLANKEGWNLKKGPSAFDFTTGTSSKRQATDTISPLRSVRQRPSDGKLPNTYPFSKSL